MRRHERKLWRSARGLEDLGGLMAMWIEGDLRSRPGYHGRTDLPTPELTELCAALCLAGVVTSQSNPGMVWCDDVAGVGRSRICIEGFADDDALAGLRAACAGTDLVVVANRTPAHRSRGESYDIPLVQHNYRTVLTLCHPGARSDLEWEWQGISRESLAAIVDAWQIAIIDPEWGRSDLLWDTLTSRFLAGVR